MKQVMVKYNGVIIGEARLKGQFVAPENLVGYANDGVNKPHIDIARTKLLVHEFFTHQYPNSKLNSVIDLDIGVEGEDFTTITGIRLKDGFETVPTAVYHIVTLKKKEEPTKAQIKGMTPKEQLADLVMIPQGSRTRQQEMDIKRLKHQLRKESESKEDKPAETAEEKQHRAYIAKKAEDRAYAEFTGKGGRR